MSSAGARSSGRAAAGRQALLHQRHCAETHHSL